MTEHDISTLLRKLDKLSSQFENGNKQSADRHTALHAKLTTIETTAQDSQERISALERDRVRHSGFIREQSSSMHEVVLETEKQKTALQKLNTPLNRTIGLAIALGPTLLVNAEHMLERVWSFLVNLAL